MLTQLERDSLLDTLSEPQKEFIVHFMKRGKRTQFSNLIAKWKAESKYEEGAEETASIWELIDYIDAGPDWSAAGLQCECGRKLRRQYIVSNTITGVTHKFGRDHFQDHTNISPELAKSIIKGFDKIDFEMDEILIKIMDGWSLENEWLSSIPEDMVFPKDIAEHLGHDIPLLERQVNRLRYEIRKYLKECEDNEQAKRFKEQKRLKDLKRVPTENILKEVSQENLYKHSEKEQTEQPLPIPNRNMKSVDFNKMRLSLPKKHQDAVREIINKWPSDNISTLSICWELIKNHGANSEMYATNKKPKIYMDVQLMMNRLVEEGVLELTSKSLDNCSYSILSGVKSVEDQQLNLF
ncbi:DUF3895 domain-containing protein [Sutcliffiella horikoshii]|uniref:DUF3895 domain-containing protein n=1 Tax=Sutcliffiella horikoshii TaxID=79883 RepID=UPI001F24A7CC|nr:DUF3895 domain-containing protein [Sutcliffiella horikoshii]MCG1023466.1 DUF3895 domain-containing protein [Sutcliffiella horikoshii]